MTWRPNKEADRRTDVAVFDYGEVVMGGTLPLCKICEREIEFRTGEWTHTVISVIAPTRRHVTRIPYELLEPDTDNYIAASTYCDRLFWYRKTKYEVNVASLKDWNWNQTTSKSDPKPAELRDPPPSPSWTPDYE